MLPVFQAWDQMNIGLPMLQMTPRFRQAFGSVQSIVTSNAQNDSGLFETNLRDDRYLPFEGAGVESSWRIELPGNEIRQFDFNSISDVILHVRYTAREAGNLKEDAIAFLKESVLAEADKSPYLLLQSLPHDYPNEWHKFAITPNASFTITIRAENLPYWTKVVDLDRNLTATLHHIKDGKKLATLASITLEKQDDGTSWLKILDDAALLNKLRGLVASDVFLLIR